MHGLLFIVVAHQVRQVVIRLLKVYTLCDHHLLVLLCEIFRSIVLWHGLPLFNWGPESVWDSRPFAWSCGRRDSIDCIGLFNVIGCHFVDLCCLFRSLDLLCTLFLLTVSAIHRVKDELIRVCLLFLFDEHIQNTFWVIVELLDNSISHQVLFCLSLMYLL